MIEERVRVLSVEDSGIWVEGIQQSACRACNARSGCGQHALSQLGRKVKLWVPVTESVRPGEDIIVGLPEGALARSALVLYGSPLLFLVSGAGLGQLIAGESGAVGMGLLSFAAGFYVARYWSSVNQKSWQPGFIRRCSVQDSLSVFHSSH